MDLLKVIVLSWTILVASVVIAVGLLSVGNQQFPRIIMAAPTLLAPFLKIAAVWLFGVVLMVLFDYLRRRFF